MWGWKRENNIVFDVREIERSKIPIWKIFQNLKQSVAEKVDESSLVCYGWEVTKAFSEGQSTTYGGLMFLNWP